MPAPTMSHLIATSALILMIATMQVFYFYVVDNVWEEMTKRELREISDYVSDTIANIYHLANSTNHRNITLQKALDLPNEIAESSYTIQVSNDTDGFAQTVITFLETKSWINADSWLPPGLRVEQSENQRILVNGKTVLACCRVEGGIVYVWLCYE